MRSDRMNNLFERKAIGGHVVNVYESPAMIMGFTETDFPLDLLKDTFKPHRLVELKQIHSNTVWLSSQVQAGVEGGVTKGDAIILDQKNTMAVIKTADCTPLFLWSEEKEPVGAVVHAGWRGLQHDIERKAIDKLIETFPHTSPDKLHAFLGPAIEAQCYEVGKELYDSFSKKSYRDAIFLPHPKEDKLLMDVRKGVHLSLIESGIPQGHIVESPLCTFCEKNRFPSYRREPHIDGRIFNFMIVF